MNHSPPGFRAIDRDFCSTIEQYRAQYLEFFLDTHEAHRDPGYRGGHFNINSISGRPYEHTRCYTWTDGRSLGELAVAHLRSLGDRDRLGAYAEHIAGCLLERYRLNGYLPHSVDDRTNVAADDPLNVPLGPGQSSYAHVFAMNGLWQYALVFQDAEAEELADHLFRRLEEALAGDTFLEGAAPRPRDERSQGPFMISLGACADVLETLAHLGAGAEQKARWLDLGQQCVRHVLDHHWDRDTGRFWEVCRDGAPARGEDGVVIADPGHTIEFAGFAARFARFLPEAEEAELTATCGRIFTWAANVGFHPTADLIYKNVNCDTGEPVRDSVVPDISRVVDEHTWRDYFGGTGEPVRLATFPWWVPMEAMATGVLVRGACPEADALVLRAARGIFTHFRNPAIKGLCYQSIGDGFFKPVDIQPATPTLDLMHSHRSLRIVVRELNMGG